MVVGRQLLTVPEVAEEDGEFARLARRGRVVWVHRLPVPAADLGTAHYTGKKRR